MKYTKLALIFALVAVLATPVLADKDGSVESRSFLGIHIGGRDDKDTQESEQHDQSDDQSSRDAEHRALPMGIKGDIKADVKAHVETNGRDRAVAEIDRRVADLNQLKTRIDGMKRVSDSSKTSLKGSIDAQIQILTDLKAKIQADTDDATLKADIQSITKSYRIYMLVMPQVAVLATTDRIHTTMDLMTTFGTKLQTRITDAQTAGKDVTALQAAYADYTAKISDAGVQADAASALVVNLKPDNGDQATMDANKKALADAKAKLKVAQSDLKTARKDAQTIVQGLKTMNVSVESKVKVEDR